MCDTMVALPPATAGGAVLFAKNSDRERDEAQFVELLPAATHPEGATLRCTYIDIPQAPRTHAVLLSRPCWIWGAEMGANEHGVVIGNEAVFATIPAARTPALIGMDLLRLGLERAASAAEAVTVITTLLEQFGQGGNCGLRVENLYDNSFLIADAREAFVLETIGRMWAVERCPPIRAISNVLSIGRGAIARAGGGLVEHARAQGWCTDAGDLDLAEAYMDRERDAVTRGRLRCARAAELLGRRAGALGIADMMAALRDHGAEADGVAGWHPDRSTTRAICMHAGAGVRRGQSVGSMVAELHPGRPGIYWVTGTSAPCLSIFKPVLLVAGLPTQGRRPTDRDDTDREGAASLWWRHERFHRAAMLGDHAGILAEIGPERDALEAGFAARIAALGPAPAAGEAAAVVGQCWAEADAAEERWFKALPARPGRIPQADYAASWKTPEPASL
ncbi:dipeptidase [Stella humosa]|uniref:Dipeptidase n=1 Tax=Stella humosa TaxID=94 RepID=A0A3N1MA39_9PROT|nr:C69 family dipeptidase [Stella humosa]ROP99566.1 dipeptidase [Stella humosa]BBK31213.1 dipeptidase [Stella humosa]